MNDAIAEESNEGIGRVLISVVLFWVGYLGITLVVGFVTSMLIASKVWQLTAWGFLSSAVLLALPRLLKRVEQGPGTSLGVELRPSSVGRLSVGLLIGAAAFGLHLLIISIFAGPPRFEWVAGVGAVGTAIYFARFLSTSCMEEIGFRGYPLRRLMSKVGVWGAVTITTVAFGLSHLSYGWDLRTIALGVLPWGLVWGMSAVATRGLAVPIGLHAAWNFASWTAGARSETGLLRMIVDEDALARTQQVGMVSYLSICGGLTVVFWLVHRRNVRRAALT